MSNEDLNQRLYERAKGEQDKFRDSIEGSEQYLIMKEQKAAERSERRFWRFPLSAKL